MGPHTVTFKTFATTTGRVGPVKATPTTTDVSGCFMQPIGVTEVITETDVESEIWRCISPPVAAVTAADTTGELIFNGDTFEITGTKPFYDFAGLDHVTVDCKIQRG
jgi:hypothetical protein